MSATWNGRGPDFSARITGTRRLPSSVNGNPAYSVTFDNGTTLATAEDAQIGYAITNYRGDGDRPGPLVNVWTKTGRRYTRLIWAELAS